MSRETKEFKKNNRIWLNPLDSHDTGALQWHVYADAYGMGGIISIWDCGRKISLNFDSFDEKKTKQRAKKIDQMIEELQKFKYAMGEAYKFKHSQELEDGVLLHQIDEGGV